MTIILDGTTGITTPAINSSGDLELPGGTANGVLYLNGSKIATSGSTITYNGTTFGVDSAVVFNDSGADVDFRVESDTSASAFFLDGATGNVGLKTDTPATILSLENSLLLESTATDFPSSTYDGAAFVAKTGSGGSAPFDQAGSLVYRTRVSSTAGRSSHIFYTGSPSVERLRINESGKVGIGTSSPQTILHTRVVADTDSEVARFENLNVAGTDAHRLSIFADSVSNLVSFRSTGSNAGGFAFYSGNSERARIDSSGKVGIGTSSPSYILDIQAASSPTISVTDTTNSCQLLMYAQNTSAVMGVYANYPLLFATNSTERARITSGGSLLVGTTSGTYTAAGCINSEVSAQDNFCFSGVNTNSTNPRGLYLRNPNTTAGDYAIYFEASSATKFYVNGNGVIYSTNTSVQSVSDARHKENVRDLDKGLAEVLALKPRRFDWKEGKGTGAKNVAGFIAQEVETVLPELVGEWKETVDAEETFKSIGMANVIPMLVKAIQELKAELDEAKAKIAALEAK